jgi:hypothetical protein
MARAVWIATTDRLLHDAFSANGLDEQTPWTSAVGFHVKAKPNQELAASFMPCDGATEGSWMPAFIRFSCKAGMRGEWVYPTELSGECHVSVNFFGLRLRARRFDNQKAEGMMKCDILNRMRSVGLPVSERIE